MIKKINNLVAFGEINKEIFEKLLKKEERKLINQKKLMPKKLQKKLRKEKNMKNLILNHFSDCILQEEE